jgi:hypothetical protein
LQRDPIRIPDLDEIEAPRSRSAVLDRDVLSIADLRRFAKRLDDRGDLEGGLVAMLGATSHRGRRRHPDQSEDGRVNPVRLGRTDGVRPLLDI